MSGITTINEEKIGIENTQGLSLRSVTDGVADSATLPFGVTQAGDTDSGREREDAAKLQTSTDKPDKPTMPPWLEYFKVIAGSGGALVLGIAALIWSIHTFAIQDKHLQAQLELQQASIKLQREQTSLKLMTDLLPKLGCVVNEQRESALELLRIAAPEQLRLAISMIERCPAGGAEAKKQIEMLKQQAATSELERAFVFMVNNGRQYLINGLDGAAARTFDGAANSLPQTYVLENVLDVDQVIAARKAFSDGQFSEAADLFIEAYRKVPTDVGSSSSAFRRRPRQ